MNRENREKIYMLICLTKIPARYWRCGTRQTQYLVAFLANRSQADKHENIYGSAGGNRCFCNLNPFWMVVLDGGGEMNHIRTGCYFRVFRVFRG